MTTQKDPSPDALAHVTEDSLLHGFSDLVEASTRCPPNCDHTGAGGECGLDRLVAEGGADPRRLASYRRLLALRAGDDPNRFREDGAGDNDPGE